MKTCSISNQAKTSTLRCLLVNSGRTSELNAAEFGSGKTKQYRALLKSSFGRLAIGAPEMLVDWTWFQRPPGEPVGFLVTSGERLLLAAGVATTAGGSARLRRRFAQLQRTSFRFFPAGPSTGLRGTPWMGIILLPDALRLSDAHLDALCEVGRAAGWLWFERQLHASHRGFSRSGSVVHRAAA